ncbi:hypothetical protein ACFVTX_18260 [Agromyces sp. NPDC058136]|uniref:hypothetical protein n=1 Tax=Agromyces sp. NPDC058136 TaxID=3346354 RepID=UPI0036D927D9
MAQPEPRWHPILAAREGPVGTWRMIDTLGAEYGVIRLVRVAGTPVYVATMRGQDIGSGNSLRLACERVHAAFLQSGQPGGRIGWESETAADRRRA